jgi:hypothetical protein
MHFTDDLGSSLYPVPELPPVEIIGEYPDNLYHRDDLIDGFPA